ncbi:SIMPL domain-containing protein [Actinocrinis sp.]|uniref:SIMPL domain-containing protein n=1 Tax=Actinocrinis sp. TaxID=1920516 RepID=UPI002D40569C|nr:SIMPL domain-containing protein [Actinocrinis sp.]HZP54400.1 SIMPL domain-containing protein [Actinocrinis sp.]
MISVRGEATLLVDPEVADLTAVIIAQARDRREAFERLVKRNDEVLSLVRSYGDSIDRVESTGVSVAPELRKGKDEKIRSYSGAVRVRITVADLAILGELLARIAEFEAATIDGPHWRLRTSSPVYREARGRAVAEAVTRARDYAEAIGSRITGLIELADTGLTTTSVVPRMARSVGGVVFGARAASAPAPAEPPALDLEPQQQTVYATVEARFEAAQPEFPVD